MIKNILYSMSITATVILQNCSCNNSGTDRPTGNNVPPKPPVNVHVPAFNADSSFQFIKKQVDFGPRVPNTPAHQKCGNFLAATLNSFADTVYQQQAMVRAFDGKMLNMRNIIAEFNPSAAKRILLMAHWDTRPFADQDSVRKDKPIDGANDGGSGVGVLLEIGRVLSSNNQSLGVDIVLFDAEDYGKPRSSDNQDESSTLTWCLGSQYWSKNLHRQGYRANYGILLDMVGAKNAKFAREQSSLMYAKDVVDKVWQTAREAGFYDHFVYYDSGPIIDDHLYVNSIAKIPSIDIIEYNPRSPSGIFTSSWHTHRDNMDVIDKATLKAVGQTLLELIYRVEAPAN